MQHIIINTPNGLQANPALNRLADVLDRTEFSTLLKYNFELGFDGAWELVIQPVNPELDTAFVFKQSDRFKLAQELFVYADGFNNGALHTRQAPIHNKDLEKQVRAFLPGIIKCEAILKSYK